MRTTNCYDVNKIEETLTRLLELSSPVVIKAYEEKIEMLESQKREALQKLATKPPGQQSFDTFIEHAMNFLANPWNLWASGDFTLKRTVLRLAFSERLAYHRNEGYRTPKTAIPFKVLEQLDAQNSEMVPLT